ncbi:MAG: DUF2931 family protein [Bacteroidales bacterium]|nr:DUF2931 family protein [Bacteroidales bacterium]
MRNRYLFILLLLLPLFACSQNYKLVDQSSKNKPKWMTDGSYPETYFIQANKVATLEEGQNNVMTTLLNQIASAVAVQVTGETKNIIDWTTVDLGGMTRDEYVQKVETNTSVKIAKMPALQGVSLSKAEIYWEKYTDKKTKETYYDYYILYPFSTSELQQLIDSYNAQEKALNDKIDDFRNQLDGIDDVSKLLTNIDDMKLLMKEIGEDDFKYARLSNVVKQYEQFVDNIDIHVVENKKDVLIIQLVNDDVVMKTSSLPKLRGECARDFSTKHVGNRVEITFNTFDCYEQDDNYVEVRFNIGKKRLVKKIRINL